MSDVEQKSDVDPQRREVPPIQVELAEQQFVPILEKLQEKAPKDRLDRWLKWGDLIEKYGIGLISLILAGSTVYLSWREFRGKHTQFQARSFAGLFAEKPEARLEAAASAANDLDGKELGDFMKVVLLHFDDTSPTFRDYAKNAVINMASSCYDSRKVPQIVDAMTEGLNKERDKPTKENAANVVGQIGYPTDNLLSAFDQLLRNPVEDPDVTVQVCSAVTNLKWTAGLDQVSSDKVSTLRASIESLLHQSGKPDGVLNACRDALPKLPTK
jgi:hypothetical protein